MKGFDDGKWLLNLLAIFLESSQDHVLFTWRDRVLTCEFLIYFRSLLCKTTCVFVFRYSWNKLDINRPFPAGSRVTIVFFPTTPAKALPQQWGNFSWSRPASAVHQIHEYAYLSLSIYICIYLSFYIYIYILYIYI